MSQTGWIGLLLGLVMAAAPSATSGREPEGPAPQLRIEPLASLDSLQMEDSGAWSPHGSLLALRRGPNQVWAFDASRPEIPPRLVHDAKQWIRSYRWSPDGAWLLLLVGDANPENHRSLLAVPVRGGRPETLRSGIDIWTATWGPDGIIYYRVKGAWEEAQPPARWRTGASFAARPQLAAELGPGLWLGFRRPDPRRLEHLVALGTVGEDGMRLRIIDAVPDGSRYLVSMSEDTSGATRIVDREGRTLLDLRRAGIAFEPTAISGDAGLIVGFSGTFRGEEGWTQTWLEAADADGRWGARIAGGEGGQAPQMSREGSLIAFTADKGTKVGRLVVDRR